MANLALFDLDHTLIPTDSDHEWGRFMVKQGMVDAENFARENDRFFADYKAGKLDIHAYLIAMLTPLAKYSRAQLADLHAQYMHEVIKPAIFSSRAGAGAGSTVKPATSAAWSPPPTNSSPARSPRRSAWMR